MRFSRERRDRRPAFRGEAPPPICSVRPNQPGSDARHRAGLPLCRREKGLSGSENGRSVQPRDSPMFLSSWRRRQAPRRFLQPAFGWQMGDNP